MTTNAAPKAVSPAAVSIAKILINSTKASGRIFESLRELILPFTSEEANRIAAEARAAWRKAGYDRKAHGQSHADSLLSLLLRCKREGISPLPESQAACKAALKALTASASGNAEASDEDAEEAAEREQAEKARQAGRERIAAAVEDFAVNAQIQPQHVLELAKVALEYRDVLLAMNDALAAGVAKVTIIAALRELQREQQRANRDADADAEPAQLESEAA